FYRRQKELLGTDSGFRELGYLIVATDEAGMLAGRERVAMQARAGLAVRWLEAAQASELNPWLAPDSIYGASYLATDGCIDPARNVRAYSIAMEKAGVELREFTTFTGLELAGGDGTSRVAAVLTDGGRIETSRVDLSRGLYWRLEDGGLLFGMSNHGEAPGPARSIDWAYLESMRVRLARFLPVTRGLELRKVWAATIDYTADHQPILGPGLAADRL